MKKVKRILLMAISTAMIITFFLPLVMTVICSFMNSAELAVVFGDEHPFRWIPYQVSVSGYFQVLFANETYLATFWNSMLIAIASVALQVLSSLVVGYTLVRGKFRGRTALFYLYMIVMLIPFQVTLLPTYILAKDTGIYNTWLALVLPGGFAALGVFLMRQFILSFPDDILEAARLDTDSNLRIIFEIVAPNVKGGLIAVAVLAFAENWNMIEQPLILLENEWLYPLALKLHELPESQYAVRFAGSVLYMLPSILLFFLFENELVDGAKHMKL